VRIASGLEAVGAQLRLAAGQAPRKKTAPAKRAPAKRAPAKKAPPKKASRSPRKKAR
jgi:S-DNA-T family DNA segregation ATPase FtsK/SpoIIIE